MKQTLLNRLMRLERKANAPRISFNVVAYARGDEHSRRQAFAMAARKIMLIPDFGSEAEWIAASQDHQRKLLAANATRR